jgi:hypothetical protein
LDKIIDINRSNEIIRPKKIECYDKQWHVKDDLEFFIDFEAVNNIFEDFT